LRTTSSGKIFIIFSYFANSDFAGLPGFVGIGGGGELIVTVGSSTGIGGGIDLGIGGGAEVTTGGGDDTVGGVEPGGRLVGAIGGISTIVSWTTSTISSSFLLTHKSQIRCLSVA
jgi:hypothetical protein